MFLKRIELSGFKSFADRTELEFVQGITAVVGPNGSGKSNISDGIRWVLGEQSAKSLRGGNMQDIIFAGSDSRRAVNFGEVSLTLDNSDKRLSLDFSEVTVTRRIHRSGESEYFINKQSCRLKDITELFMDTGIGKEAYSIIGQGRIEEILSSRGEDRRGIFEEASGIVKYKSRKKEATKKLDETEQNLLRIHDLVSELEDQIEPLRVQSEKALKFKELKGELKTKEISLYVYQIEQLHRSWSEATERFQSLTLKQAELAAEVGKHDAHLEQFRQEIRKLEAEVDTLQEQLFVCSAELEKSEGHGEVLKERRKNLLHNRSQTSKQLETLEQKTTMKRDELAETRVKLDAVTEQLRTAQARLTAEEARMAGVAAGTSSSPEEELKGELLDALNALAQHRNELRYLEQQQENLRRRLDKHAEEQQQYEAQAAEAEQKRQDAEHQRTAAKAEAESVREAYLTLTRSLESKQKLQEDSQLLVRKWEQKLEALVSRKDTLIEMQNDYDGFQHGVKEVLKAKNKPNGLQGVHGAVAELIEVPASVETAVETSLGAAMQHIVMENEATARTAIQFLKQRQLGRATFLPLDVIKSRQIGESDRRAVEGMPGYVGIGSQLIRTQPKYQHIIESLLGNVIVAETLEYANKIAARNQYRYRVVTLEGDVVNAGGSMTGGSLQKKSTGLLGRQRLIDQLNEEIAEAKQQVAQVIAKQVELKQELAAGRNELDLLRTKGDAARAEEQRLAAGLQQLEHEANHAARQLSVITQEASQLRMEQEDAQKRHQELTAGLASLQEDELRLQEAIRFAEEQRKANEFAKDELQSQLTDLKVQAASFTQERAALVGEFQRIENELQSLAEERQSLEGADAELAGELASSEAESVQQVETANTLKLRKAELSQKLDFHRAARAEAVAKLDMEEGETKEQRQLLRQTEEQLHQTEVRVNRLDVELDNLLKKLVEDYEIGYELAKERYPIPEDIPGTQNEVRELKRAISALGEVNLGAIEEYQRVGERFEFLSTQKQDLTEAKQALYQVIKEMDDEMSKRFIHTFEQIREHFTDVFTRLFGGGRADLVLTDPSNLLDTGVDIVAQPPGKKLQNLQLLSGGEKALTAIALLFAILRVKPVPFCVLDEVEAALDEANVSRFAEYLREFSSQTQFIVVTHRKGTMEEADVLYGVTMEEGGVSKLVSVRLEDEEAEIA